MHLLIVTLVSLITLSVSTSAKTEAVYSNVELDNCAIAYESDETGAITRECASFGNYKIRISGSDGRYGFIVSYNGKVIEIPELDHFHSPGSKVIEWRYTYDLDTREISYNSLMFRLEHATGIESKNDSILYAVRLNQESSCLLETFQESDATSPGSENIKAREILDNINTPCKK